MMKNMILLFTDSLNGTTLWFFNILTHNSCITCPTSNLFSIFELRIFSTKTYRKRKIPRLWIWFAFL